MGIIRLKSKGPTALAPSSTLTFSGNLVSTITQQLPNGQVNVGTMTYTNGLLTKVVETNPVRTTTLSYTGTQLTGIVVS